MREMRGNPESDQGPDFEKFPENMELSGEIQAYIERMNGFEPYLVEDYNKILAFRNIADIQRYIVSLYNNIRQGSKESSMKDCIGIASEAFLVSFAGARSYYGDISEDRGYELGKDIMVFVKKMGDSIATNEIDLDLGSDRWVSSVDIIMDIISSLSVLTNLMLSEAEGAQQIEMRVTSDIEYNVMTGSSLIAAYSMILYMVLKEGTYRGQTLCDIQAKAA
ncbi:MAG: hypothetical protein ACM3QV_00215 [Caulobacteraceae bacterium]